MRTGNANGLFRSRLLVDQAWSCMEDRMQEIEALKALVASHQPDRGKVDLDLVRDLAAMVCSEVNQRRIGRLMDDDLFDEG